MPRLHSLAAVSVTVTIFSAGSGFAQHQVPHGLAGSPDATLSYGAVQDFEDAPHGDWIIAIGLASEGPPSNHSFDVGDRSQFKVQCVQGNTRVSIVWNSSTGRAEPPSLKMWLDDELVESESWTRDDESFYTGNAVRLLERLLQTTSFRIEYGVGFFEQTISPTFDLSSLDQAIGPIRSFCDW